MCKKLNIILFFVFIMALGGSLSGDYRISIALLDINETMTLKYHVGAVASPELISRLDPPVLLVFGFDDMQKTDTAVSYLDIIPQQQGCIKINGSALDLIMNAISKVSTGWIMYSLINDKFVETKNSFTNKS